MKYIEFRLGLNLERFSLKQEFNERETLKEGHNYSVDFDFDFTFRNTSPSRSLPRLRLWRWNGLCGIVGGEAGAPNTKELETLDRDFLGCLSVRV